MRYSYLFLVLLYVTISAFSCDDSIVIDASTKYRVYGSVSDANANPLSDISIEFLAWNEEETALIQCANTDGNGVFDFVISDPETDINIIRINREAYRNGGNCEFTFQPDYEYVMYFFNDSLFVDYELEVDFVLRDAVELSIANNFECDSVNFYQKSYVHSLRHSGVIIESEPQSLFLEFAATCDTVSYNIGVNQEVEVSVLGLLDTLVSISTEPYLLELK